MLLKNKNLADLNRAETVHNTARNAVQPAAKIAAYCATICSTLLLLGCANIGSHTQNTVANDPLSPQNLNARTAAITYLAQAQQMEQAAIARQNAADATLKTAQADCYRKFFVNRCLDQQADIRNQIWDQAQIERSAARLYIRQHEAEQFYAAMAAADAGDPCPVSYGLNSQLVKEEKTGRLYERTWKVGGMYSPAIERIVYWLEKAQAVAQTSLAGVKPPAENRAYEKARKAASRDGSLIGDLYQGQPMCVAGRLN